MGWRGVLFLVVGCWMFYFIFFLIFKSKDRLSGWIHKCCNMLQGVSIGPCDCRGLYSVMIVVRQLEMRSIFKLCYVEMWSDVADCSGRCGLTNQTCCNLCRLFKDEPR
jgi:hypothetical protein